MLEIVIIDLLWQEVTLQNITTDIPNAVPASRKI
jgi:hypothetical protein